MIVEAAQSAFLGVNQTTASVIVNLLRSCSVYQFHDTSDGSSFKTNWDSEDNVRLRSHGGNLAAVLYRLERQDVRRFDLICRHIGRILPVFDRFAIEESYGKVLLRWKAKGTDKTFGAHLTSDGSLRFFALVTLLNLPSEMLPGVILLDEPELGLHPAAIALIGDMIKSLAEERQIIVATQSPLLVDVFGLDEILVLELRDGQTNVRKLDAGDYQTWLDESFTTGELWQKKPSWWTPMIRLAISVEGQTEEEFVKEVLADHLRDLGVEPQPIKAGGRGGNVSVERLASEMAKLYWSFDFVTSLVDFYGFLRRKASETVDQLETRINEEVDRTIGREWGPIASVRLCSTA